MGGGGGPHAQRRQIARPAPLQGDAGQSAGNIRRRLQQTPHIRAKSGVGQKERNGLLPLPDQIRISQRPRQTLRQQAPARRGRGHVDGGEQGALAGAAEGAHQLEIGPRGRVDLQNRSALGPAGAGERGPGAQLGALDIADKGGGGGQFGPGEGAEPVQRRHPIPFAQHPLGVPGLPGRGGDGNAPIREELLQHGLAAQRLPGHDFARIDARHLGAETRLRAFQQHEGAGGDVGGGEPIDPVVLGAAHPGQRHQHIGAGGV